MRWWSWWTSAHRTGGSRRSTSYFQLYLLSGNMYFKVLKTSLIMRINLHYELEVFMTWDFVCRNGEIYPAITEGTDSPGVERLVVKVVVIVKLYLSDTLSPVNRLSTPSHSNVKFLLPPSTSRSRPRLSWFSDSSSSPVFSHIRRSDYLWFCVHPEVDKFRGHEEILSHTSPVL